MSERTFKSPAAFQTSLEARLKKLAQQNNILFERQRQLFLYDRLLARFEQETKGALLVKGGIALEFRLRRARATKDIDIQLRGDTANTLVRLQSAGRLDLGDWLSFEIQEDKNHPTMQNDGIEYEGYRFKGRPMLGGKQYGTPFGIDVVYGGTVTGASTEVTADDILDFIGVAAPRHKLYPLETHIAEKLHAYTMPRAYPNSRVKDLPDIALLAKTQEIDGALLRKAMDATFTARGTHPLPATLPAPPAFWEAPYQEIRRESNLSWAKVTDVFTQARLFLDPVLSAQVLGLWSPGAWSWADPQKEKEVK